jgi:hypothetical protein
MKAETAQEKLNRMLGLAPEKVAEVKAKTTGKVVEVSEDDIQEFREAQGLLYFLKAPELFTYKVCKHCGDGFLVSRMYVGFCSYTCIRKELEKDGIKWRKGNDIEALVADVYEGNEPIWLRTRVLKKLLEMVSRPPNESEAVKSILPSEPVSGSESVGAKSTLMSSAQRQPQQDVTTRSSSPNLGASPTSSVSSTTTTSPSGGTSISKTSASKRRIISPP